MTTDGPPPVWYFAYGANMTSSVLLRQRKVQPLHVTSNVTIASHVLSFDLLGVPYNEPALASLTPKRASDKHSVHGIAYLLSAADVTRVIASEGAGIAYRPITLTAHAAGESMEVITLIAKRPARTRRRPSKRYLGLLMAGAKEHSLPQTYQAFLAQQPMFEPLNSIRFRMGKSLFDAVWLRVQRVLQKGIYRYNDGKGNLPPWFLVIFDMLLWIMWTYHDLCHAWLWERGDGL